MSTTWNVRGPAIVSVGVGEDDALVTLGFTESGVRGVVRKHWGRVLSDLGGPAVQSDIQDFGELVFVRCSLISVDWSVLNAVLNRGDRAAAGQRNTPGLLMGFGGYSFAVAVSSANDAPLYVPCALVNDDADLAFGTVAKPDEITFMGWGLILGSDTSGKDAPVWGRSLPV